MSNFRTVITLLDSPFPVLLFTEKLLFSYPRWLSVSDWLSDLRHQTQAFLPLWLTCSQSFSVHHNWPTKQASRVPPRRFLNMGAKKEVSLIWYGKLYQPHKTWIDAHNVHHVEKPTKKSNQYRVKQNQEIKKFLITLPEHLDLIIPDPFYHWTCQLHWSTEFFFGLK